MALFIWWLVLSFLHPFHVSVCEIEYRPTLRSLQITHRIFLDDLEQALQKETGKEDLDILEETDSLAIHKGIRDYLKENFAVSISGKTLPYQYLGGEIEEDVMWCYVEITGVAPFTEMTVTNRILTEIFDDQENLVHVRNKGTTRSLRLHKDKPTGQVQFD